MTENVPPPSGPAKPVRRTPWLLYGCGGVLAIILIIVASVFITIWWIQRPIKPVVLSPKEKAVADAKIRLLEEPNVPPSTTNRPAGTIGTTPTPNPDRDRVPPNQLQDRVYIPGSKVIRLTEREINGLLNANTDLGQTVRLEFGKDAINAYLAVPIPQDFPIGGGKMFRARGRFRVSLGNGGTPYVILEDVTVFGLSLPKAWLGGLKGENLLNDAIGGERNGGPVLRGIKSLRVEPGALVLEVED